MGITLRGFEFSPLNDPAACHAPNLSDPLSIKFRRTRPFFQENLRTDYLSSYEIQSIKVSFISEIVFTCHNGVLSS